MRKHLSPTSYKYIINILVPKIQAQLTDDLLKLEFRKTPHNNKLYGHCYVATEALWHMLTIHQRELLKPHYLKINGITHWFLKYNHYIIDPTAEQFNFLPDYNSGIGCGFLTKIPSKRTKIVLERMGYTKICGF